MSKTVKNTVRVSVGTALGAPVAFAFLTHGGIAMDATSAFTFTVAVSLFSMAVILGAAITGAYRFLRNVGLFKGHYYY
ncbi:MAG: hypothetical protein C4532_03545 [Candidatus Abyssobacteria bacterium SURF_17]|jgi:hypothetical protein|uniref:Uncharacterized protein n=1 Tax=Candidatus Abyssobacteria bacterium SURF_17 TaxID=2093361 RepID=A0A419F602_9BACT|nr:MAG: hypothetical protein C4532_03545 [Candidatus Abyssubacteria bacterium SURF_17]